MKFKGKPIENSLKLPPCQFSDVYSDKKGGKRRTLNKKRRTVNKKRRTVNKKRRTVNSNRTRKGGSSKPKSVQWLHDTISDFWSNTASHSSISFNKKSSTKNVNADKILSMLEEGKGSTLIPKRVTSILKSKKT